MAAPVTGRSAAECAHRRDQEPEEPIRRSRGRVQDSIESATEGTRSISLGCYMGLLFIGLGCIQVFWGSIRSLFGGKPPLQKEEIVSEDKVNTVKNGINAFFSAIQDMRIRFFQFFE